MSTVRPLRRATPGDPLSEPAGASWGTDSIFAAEPCELIAPGPYKAVAIDAHVYPAFRTQKLSVEFEVLVPDSTHIDGMRRVRLFRHYNIHKPHAGKIKQRPSSAYYREWTLIVGHRPSRGERMSPRALQGKMVVVEVRTVTRDARQQDLATLSHYSVIGAVLRSLTGGRA